MLWYRTHYTPGHGDTPGRWTTLEYEAKWVRTLYKNKIMITVLSELNFYFVINPLQILLE